MFRTEKEYYRDLEIQQKDLPAALPHLPDVVVCPYCGKLIFRTPLCSCHYPDQNLEKYEML